MPRPIITRRKPDAASGQPGRSWPWQLAAAILLAGVGIAVYANSFDDPFVFDSLTFIRDNPAIRKVWPWLFELGGERSMGGADRPVGFLTFALNYTWNGYNIWGYHAVNLAIHVTAAWLLFDVVRRTLSRGRLADRYAAHAWGLAFAVALLWLVHPLQTNSVTYVYQRLEALMGLFYLATLWCFSQGLDSEHRSRWFAASVVCCALGMGTKEVMVTAPLIVLWYDRAFIARSWSELFHDRGKYYGALAGTWLLLAGLMFANREDYVRAGVLVVKGVSPLQYALSQPGVLLHYLKLAFWPDRLCLDYAWPVAAQAADIVPQAIAILALVALTAWCAYRWPAWGFLGAWFFLILAPTSSVAPIRDLAFEHRMYLPLAAVAALVVLAVYHAAQFIALPLASSACGVPAGASIMAGATLLAVAAILGWRTWVRNEDYRTPLAIWQDTLQTAPRNARARSNLGPLLIEKGDFVGAMTELNQAIALDPDYAIAYSNRGNAFSQQHECERALADYDRAIALDPQYITAYQNRGNALAKLDRLPEAIHDFSSAIELAPECTEAYVNRGIAYGRTREYVLAMQDLNRAIELQPDLAVAYVNRGIVYVECQRLPEALRDYDQAIQLNPDFATAYLNRARVFLVVGYLGRARSDVRMASRLGAVPIHDFLQALQKATAAAASRRAGPNAGK